MDQTELCRLTIGHLGELLRKQEISPVEATQAALDWLGNRGAAICRSNRSACGVCLRERYKLASTPSSMIGSPKVASYG